MVAADGRTVGGGGDDLTHTSPGLAIPEPAFSHAHLGVPCHRPARDAAPGGMTGTLHKLTRALTGAGPDRLRVPGAQSFADLLRGVHTTAALGAGDHYTGCDNADDAG